MATWNPINILARKTRPTGTGPDGSMPATPTPGSGNGVPKSNYPFVAGITPTAGGIVSVADIAAISTVDSSTGQKLWEGRSEPAGIGGVITYTVDGVQKVAVAANYTMAAWPIKPSRARVVILGLDSAAAKK
jgi:alcohol dehydrogenase (cytochrome c)